MLRIKKYIDSFLSLLMFIVICLSLSGFCGHSGGGISVAPANKKSICDAKINRVILGMDRQNNITSVFSYIVLNQFIWNFTNIEYPTIIGE